MFECLHRLGSRIEPCPGPLGGIYLDLLHTPFTFSLFGIACLLPIVPLVSVAGFSFHKQRAVEQIQCCFSPRKKSRAKCMRLRASTCWPSWSRQPRPSISRPGGNVGNTRPHEKSERRERDRLTSIVRITGGGEAYTGVSWCPRGTFCNYGK
jgi:hypothetical protein